MRRSIASSQAAFFFPHQCNIFSLFLGFTCCNTKISKTTQTDEGQIYYSGISNKADNSDKNQNCMKLLLYIFKSGCSHKTVYSISISSYSESIQKNVYIKQQENTMNTWFADMECTGRQHVHWEWDIFKSLSHLQLSRLFQKTVSWFSHLQKPYVAGDSG